MDGRVSGSAIAALALLLTAVPAFAAKTDIIVLRNGDHLTGEVTEMRQAKLQVKTDDAGTLSIEWDKVASISTAAEFDITKHDGTRLLGRFTPAAAGSLNVVDASGSATVVLMADLAVFATIKATFMDRIDGSMDLGGSYTKSSGVADLYFDAEATYRRPSFLYKAHFSTNLTRQPEAPETGRYSLNLGYTRFRESQWNVSSFVFLESNRDLGFTLRGTGAMTIGRYLTRSNHVELLLGGGLAGGREAPVDAETVTNVDTVIATDLSVFSYDFPNTRVDFGLLVFPSLDDPGRVRLNADAKFKREILHDFFFSLTAYDAFDSRPKNGDPLRNDFGGSLSFGWTF